MRRIRIVFVLLTLTLAVPVGLLVKNALDSIDLEREVRHRTVAERVFDEMERELGGLLRREEERPFGHYRFYFVPQADAKGRYAVARSPLSRPPEEPYVVGFFQIDPDGSFHNPLIPRDSTLGKAFGDWEYSAEIDRVAKRVERIMLPNLPSAGEWIVAGERSPGFAQAPGTTRELPLAEAPQVEGEAERAAFDSGEEVDAYHALRSLNRGAEVRTRRRIEVRLARTGSRNTLHFRAVDAAEEQPIRDGTTLLEWKFPAAIPVARPRDRAGAHTYHDVEVALADRTPQALPVALSPMTGRVLGGDHLLLYRDAQLASRSYRQGLVLDFRALTEWLDATVLGGTDLARHAGRDFFLRTAKPAERSVPGAFVYLHRFAEPFDDLAMRMTLPALPDGRGAAYLYAIVALLVLAGCVGLFALYRMVAVRLRYAERRSNFVAAVSHELKTPLTAIRMHSEMLRDGMVDSPEKQDEYHATITAECERLTRLINNVLEYSRLEQGTREMNLVSAPIGPVVLEAARILEPHAKEADFRIEVQIADQLPPVRFERDAVLQVVFNLVDNALKYARSGQEKVIRLRCTAEAGGVRLSVRDSGPGVAARHLRRVFEPFYRGEDELTRTAKGTGIGLALVKGLAERMGAGVSGRNAAEGGFEVSLVFRPVSAG